MRNAVRWFILPGLVGIVLVQFGCTGPTPEESASVELGGVVMGSSGPEAGVWVVAETPDLGTGFQKIVVTNDDGRFLVPDLPSACGKSLPAAGRSEAAAGTDRAYGASRPQGRSRRP